MTKRTWAWVGAALLLALGALVTLAPVLGLGRVDPLAQLVSPRGLLAAGALVPAFAAAAWFVVHMLRRRKFSPRSKRRPAFPRVSLVLALGFTLIAGVNAGVLAHRGLAPQARIPVAELATITERSDEVTVVALNTQWGIVPAEDIARLAVATSADVLVLPETSRAQASQVVALLAGEGFEYAQFPRFRDNAMKTSILVSEGFGTYSDAGEPVSGAARAVPTADGPTITGVHPLPPSPPWPASLLYGSWGGSEAQERWSTQLDEAVAQCAASRWGILAGDFNATFDHVNFAGECGYVDALAAVGAGGWGTWPASVPAILGAPIDHILVDGDHWTPVAGWVVDVEGTDHRAVVARLLPRAVD